MTIHSNDPSVVELAKLGFPNYSGRKYKINITDSPVEIQSYWCGGSRSYHKVVNLETKNQIEVPENGTMFTKDIENKQFPCPGIAVITHTIMQGKDLGITINIHPDNMNQLSLPEPVKLSKDELIILFSTRHLKNSYGGRTNIRYNTAREETGINTLRWGIGVHLLIERGFLNKRTTITNEGKNALEQYKLNSFYQLNKILEDKEETI